ncbi:MAG TPA: LemA family protein [Azospirillaceae bacterium]|nr:LemA family protein [Azospirillaceae bacterium]
MDGWLGWVLLGAVLLYGVMLYNRLVSLRNRVRNGWAQIDVQLKRRADLVPNLVAAVKGYMVHERALFETLAAARGAALAAGDDVPRRAAAEAALGRSLHALLALAESNPEIRAGANMAAFQEELASTENRIAYARQHYNDAVLDYNTAVQSVPSNLVAGAFAFRPDPLFEVTAEEERRPVAVAF